MNKLLHLVLKDLKILLRSKSSSLIVIIGPLLVIFLLGIAFNNSSSYTINIGTYSEQYSNLSESLISKLSMNDFNVEKLQTKDDCIEGIKNSQYHACIEFPKDLKVDQNIEQEINFYVDPSKINLVYIIINTFSSKVSEKSDELSLNMTNVLLDKIQYTRQTIFEKNPLFAKITEKSNTVNTTSLGISSKLSKLDLTMNVNDFNIARIENQAKATTDSLTTLKNNASTVISSARANITTLKSAVSSSNASSSQKSSLGTDLDGITAILTTVESMINTSVSTNAKNAQDTQEMLLSVNVKLSKIETNLKAAASARTDVSKDVESIQSSIALAQANLKDLKAAIDGIDKSMGAIEVKDANKIINPVKTKIVPLTEDKTTRLNYLFPSLVIIVIMFISIILSTTIVQMEKSSQAYFRNFITPVSNIIFILGYYFSNMIIVSSQVILIMITSLLYFESTVKSSWSLVILLLFITASLFTFLGVLIGKLFNSEETATIAAISVSSILLFVSDLILPIESMPKAIIEIVQFSPFVVAQKTLRELTFYSSSYPLIQDSIMILGIYLLIFFIGALIVAGLENSHLSARLKYKFAIYRAKRKERKKKEALEKPKKVKIENKKKKK